MQSHTLFAVDKITGNGIEQPTLDISGDIWYFFLRLRPWPLTHDLEKLMNSRDYHYQCGFKFWKQSIKSILSHHAHALWHQAMTWTNVDLSSMKSHAVHLRIKNVQDISHWNVFKKIHIKNYHISQGQMRYPLTHWGLVMPHGDRELSQLWLRQWLVAWRHQAITWTNVNLSSVTFSDIHLRALP